jgi:hypothetical protein
VNVVDFHRDVIDIDPILSSKLLAPQLRLTTKATLEAALLMLDSSSSSVTNKTEASTQELDEQEDDDDNISFTSSLSSHADLQEDNCLLWFVHQHQHRHHHGVSKKDSQDRRRRTIFSHYWKTTGQQPMELIQEHSDLRRSKSNTNLTSLEEQKEEQTEQEAVSPPTPTTTRRSIFFGGDGPSPVLESARSLPELSSGSDFPILLQKTQQHSSASCLQASPRRLPSCLRSSKRQRSVSTSLSSSSSSGSGVVSFDAQIRIIRYEKPIEQHTETSDWAKLFGGI